MAYIPNATDTAEPVESQTVESAALEFRTLKASVNGRLGSLQAELDAEEVARAAGDSNLQAQLGLETAERIGADSGLNVRLSGIEALVAAVGTGPVSNANSVVFQPAGTGAVSTTVQSKLRESVSVKDFGAVGDGVTDDTAAFSAAAKNAPAAVNIVGAEANLPRAPMCKVIVPSGIYVLTSEVDTGNREVLWELDQAAKVINYGYLNGEVFRLGQRQADYHHGTTDYACSYSIRSNANLEEGAKVTGIYSATQLASYVDRDSVSLFVDNASLPALVDVESATYTTTTATVATPSVSVLRKYRRGMVIDTKHSPKWSGIIDSWNTDGSVITVTAWYEFGGGGASGTPSNGTGCVINGFTKVWAHNADVWMKADGYATSGCGFELSMVNHKGESTPGYLSPVNRMWGFDSVQLNRSPNVNYRSHSAFIARGDWWHGFYSNGQVFGYKYRGQVGSPITAVSDGEVAYYTVNGSGDTEIGLPNESGSRYIDFRTSGVTSDYDTRILATGGTSTSGDGVLAFYSAVTKTRGNLLAGGVGAQTGASAGASVIEGQSEVTASIMTARYGAVNGTAPIFHFAKDRIASNVQSGDGLGEIRFEGKYASSYYRGATILVTISGTPSATSMPGVMRFQVTKAASTMPSTALLIQADHHIAPGADNVQTLGTASARWSTVIAGKASLNALPVYADNTAAAALAVGDVYRTATGQLMVRY